MNVNADNARRLAQAVGDNIEYDQDKFFHDCGAPACIVGTAYAMAPPRHKRHGINSTPLDEADKEFLGDLLGISAYKATQLIVEEGFRWPEPFCHEATDAGDWLSRAKQATYLTYNGYAGYNWGRSKQELWRYAQAVNRRTYRMLMRNIAKRMLLALADNQITDDDWDNSSF